MSRLPEGVKSLSSPGDSLWPFDGKTHSDLGPTWPTILVSFQRTPKSYADSGIRGQILDSNLEGEALIRLQSSP